MDGPICAHLASEKCTFCAPHETSTGGKLDRIIELLEELVSLERGISDEIEYAQHRDGCKCGFCGKG